MSKNSPTELQIFLTTTTGSELCDSLFETEVETALHYGAIDRRISLTWMPERDIVFLTVSVLTGGDRPREWVKLFMAARQEPRDARDVVNQQMTEWQQDVSGNVEILAAPVATTMFDKRFVICMAVFYQEKAADEGAI